MAAQLECSGGRETRSCTRSSLWPPNSNAPPSWVPEQDRQSGSSIAAAPTALRTSPPRQPGRVQLVPEGAIGAGLVPRDIGVSSASETAMTERQIPTESLRHSTSPRGMRYPPALASACVAAFVAILHRIGWPCDGKARFGTPLSKLRQAMLRQVQAFRRAEFGAPFHGGTPR